MNITMSLEIITPEIAKEYLKHNTKNFRKINRTRAERYAKDIALGLWRVNGQTIVFDEDGVLFDGQNRLLAVTIANKPITVIVVRGIKRDVEITDCGGNRTPVQIAGASGISGYARTTQALGAVGILIAGTFNNTDKPSSASRVRFLTKNEVEFDAIGSAVNAGVKTPLLNKATAYIAAWCLYLSGEKIDAIKEFSTVVNSGFAIQGKECSPCVVLRNTFIESRGYKYAGLKECGINECDSFIQAFYDFKKGKERRIRYKTPSKVFKKLYATASFLAKEDIKA